MEAASYRRDGHRLTNWESCARFLFQVRAGHEVFAIYAESRVDPCL